MNEITIVNQENALNDDDLNAAKKRLQKSIDEKINSIRKQIKKKQDIIDKLQIEIAVLEDKIKAIEEAENQKQLMALNAYLIKNNLTPADIIKRLEKEAHQVI